MAFKVGDKVQVTKQFLSQLPRLTDKVKDGGIITKVYDREALVEFYSGIKYFIYFRGLELVNTKGRQLLFEFMKND